MRGEKVLTVNDGKPTARLNCQAIEVTAVNWTVGAEASCKCNGELIGKPMKTQAKGTRTVPLPTSTPHTRSGIIA
jgi:hypothetical protein